VSMAADPATGGYWLVAADGGIFAFDAPFLGSVGASTLGRAVVGMATTGGRGYWLVGADGGLYALGSAPFDGAVHVLALAGLTVAVDPGHDGGNGADPAYIDQPIDGGGFTEPCDTVGTTTDSGYTEHAFNFDVATRLAALLEAEGAIVVLTRPSDDGVGPCVNVRAAIGNDAHAAAAISIHADGGPTDGRGFHVLMPALITGYTDDIYAASHLLGVHVRDAFLATGMPTSTYYASQGLAERTDLGGLNLSNLPKVFIETGNMRNAADASLLESVDFRQREAQALAVGLAEFVAGR
jgi:N-acetylmuramoyl-L-alanine amidase